MQIFPEITEAALSRSTTALEFESYHFDFRKRSGRAHLQFGGGRTSEVSNTALLIKLRQEEQF
jgi:hypothetical protein